MIRSLFFLFIGIFVSAQTTSFVMNGVVLNEENKPINTARIRIKDRTYEYTTETNENGQFTKKIYDARESVSVVISAVGYQIKEQEIQINKERYEFCLSSNKYKEIDEVVIEKGIVQKGDSTIYNADYYANKKENKVIDLLKKLPNIDVNRAGKISINGKEVSKVLVENETFFTGSSSLAINTLPANAVAKFEFVENYDNNKIFGGGNDETILNISLKEEKKKLIFGDVFLEGNSWDRYNVGTNLFNYSPKTKVNLISNLNNINKGIFTIEDYILFNGGADRLLRDPMAFMNNINAKDLLELLVSDNKYAKTHIFNALNVSQNIFKDRFRLSVFNINDNNESEEIKENIIKINDKRLSFLDRKELVNYNVIGRNNIFNFVLSNINTNKVEFQYYFSLKNAATETENNKNIILLSDVNHYQSKNKYKDVLLNQTIDFGYRLSKNHSQGWLINLTSYNNKRDRLYSADKKLYFHRIFQLSNEENRIFQDNYDKNNQLKINFQHKYIFFNHHQVGINAILTRKKQNISNDFEVNNQLFGVVDNNLIISNYNVDFGLEYLFKDRSFTFSAIGDFIAVKTLFESNKNATDTRLQYILPKVKLEYKIRRIGTFSLNYKRELGDIPAHYYYIGNYLLSNNNVFVGVDSPKNPLVESMSFGYDKNSGYYQLHLKYRFSNDLQGYIYRTETTSIAKTNSVIFGQNIGKKHRFGVRLEKQILGRRLSIISKNNFSFESKNIKINGDDTVSRYDTKYFNLSIKSRFKGDFNFEIFNIYSIINYKNTFSANSYRQNEVGISLNISFIDRWEVIADASFNRDLLNNISYSKSTFKIGYFMNSNLFFNLFVNNIFGEYRKVNLKNDDYLSYYQEERVLPRFFNLGLTYKF